jgi:hypothetical protein
MTATGTPTMEVTICTPTVTNAAASSTTAMPVIYGFGFASTAVGNGVMASNGQPANGAFMGASSTDNWMFYNVDGNVGVKVDTGISTTTTRSSPQTFRITMTATSSYAWRFNHGNGTWDSIGVLTTRVSSRDLTWFIGLQQPGSAGWRNDFLFRNLKVWYSPTYRF